MATRVLLIDDNPQDRLLSRRALAAEFTDLETTEVSNPPQLDDALRAPAFDIVVTDYQLRWTDGLKVLDAVHRVAPDMPVIMFTNTGSEEIAASGLRMRLADYIVKTADHYGRLAHAVRVALENAAERKRVRERAALMSQAGSVLAGSLDYEATLAAVANLSVPAIADWCAVDIVVDGKIQRLAVAHTDAGAIETARSLERYDDPASPGSAATVIRTSTHALVPHVADETIVSYMCVPLVAHGRTMGALTFATAESRRRYADDDLRFAQELAHRAALAVDNAQAYKAMQVADRLKDEFLATLSHELRTPLNAILGYARLLKSGSVANDKTNRGIDVIERNAAALTKLVEDILDVARIVSGKVRLNIQAVDVPTVVRNAVESLAPAADAKAIRVQTTLDPDAAPIAGDPDRLQQIVWNLMSNAVKFTPKGGRVQVRLERVDSHVEIAVSDTGVGIQPDMLPHVFERFRQADSAVTRKFGGLGLGLAIVRHLVELHGGTVDASSAGEDEGATFRVCLPLMAVHPGAAIEDRRRRGATADRGLTATSGKLAGLHVLVVDDDSDALTLVREILELAGARVTTLDTAAAAVDIMQATKPHVLVADVGLPDIDGFELIRRVRQLRDDHVRVTPAIAFTAYARAEDRVKALESGFDAHLAKPADPAELVATVLAAGRRDSPPRGDNLT